MQLPPAPCGIRFTLSAAHGRTDRRGGEFRGDPAHRDTHRNVAYTTNAHILENKMTETGSAAQQVVLPALLKKIKNWIGLDLSDKNERHASMGGQANSSSTYKAAVDPVQ